MLVEMLLHDLQFYPCDRKEYLGMNNMLPYVLMCRNHSSIVVNKGLMFTWMLLFAVIHVRA